MGLTEEEQQHQQLLQTYAQATRQDLANLTASSLAQAMVSPMTVSGLASSLLQQLHAGIIITALPGPTPTTHITPTPTPMDDTASDDEDPKRGSTRSMSNDERRQRRLLRNRVAAKECRKKKKQYIQEMEDKIRRLEEENVRLHKQVAEIHAKLTLGSLHTNEGYRLMKEVEELNAKLGMAHLPSTSALTAAVVAAAQQALKSEPPLLLGLPEKDLSRARMKELKSNCAELEISQHTEA
ncbi:Skn-1-like basic-leucine zipper transcription factor, partial [Phycomyces blakesleeanus]